MIQIKSGEFNNLKNDALLRLDKMHKLGSGKDEHAPDHRLTVKKNNKDINKSRSMISDHTFNINNSNHDQ